MRIKKTSQTTPIQAQVVNTKSNSTTDSYSCDYVNKLMEYDNTERVVGTWFGKPLYRKDYNTYTPSGNNMLLDTIPNIDVVKFEGSVKFKYDTVDIYYWRDINVADASTGTLRSTYSTEENNLVIARASFDGRFLINGVRVSVYYTKTTD